MILLRTDFFIYNKVYFLKKYVLSFACTYKQVPHVCLVPKEKGIGFLDLEL